MSESEEQQELAMTPEETVASVLSRLDGLDEVEVDEHPERFDAVHDDLRRVLRGEAVQHP